MIFLAEAFTRPKMMKALAKAGFTQSYTYFTWRNTKAELTEYLTELTQPPVSDFFRPNFFTNTPDILRRSCRRYGRPAFKMRLVLAATLSPSYGIYSGYELCENQAVPGTEEYLNSEKYEIRTRDWHAPGNIKEFIARVNAIRRENPASASSPTCASSIPTTTRSCSTPRPRRTGATLFWWRLISIPPSRITALPSCRRRSWESRRARAME